MAKKKSSFIKKISISILLILLVVGGVGGYYAYQALYQSNVNLGDKKSVIIYIPTGSSFKMLFSPIILITSLKEEPVGM